MQTIRATRAPWIRRDLRLLAAAWAVVLGFGTTVDSFAAGSGGMGGGGMSGDVGAASSPREMARTAHNDGMRFKRRAERMEEEAAEATADAERTTALRSAAENWLKAIAAFRQASSLDARNHKSLNELGYSLRRIGDYANALQAYDQALALKPDFAEAIEYRAEASLALGKLDDVKAAYLRLVELDDDIAAQLLAAMQSWANRNAANTDPAVQALRAWIAERASLAQHLPGTADRTWGA